jgi:hypothetical protein
MYKKNPNVVYKCVFTKLQRSIIKGSPLKESNIVVDPVLLSLLDTLCNPDDVADLLLFQFDEGIEKTVVELELEALFVELYFQVKKFVL